MQRRLRVCMELPPRHSLGAASNSKTLAPASRAVSAAHKAALPPPITSTSYVGAGLTISSLYEVPNATYVAHLMMNTIAYSGMLGHNPLLKQASFTINSANESGTQHGRCRARAGPRGSS